MDDDQIKALMYINCSCFPTHTREAQLTKARPQKTEPIAGAKFNNAMLKVIFETIKS